MGIENFRRDKVLREVWLNRPRVGVTCAAKAAGTGGGKVSGVKFDNRVSVSRWKQKVEANDGPGYHVGSVEFLNPVL